MKSKMTIRARPANPASDLVYDPRRLRSRHVGRRIGFLLFRVRAVADPEVGWVDCGCMDADTLLPLAGVYFEQFNDLENFGAAVSE